MRTIWIGIFFMSSTLIAQDFTLGLSGQYFYNFSKVYTKPTIKKIEAFPSLVAESSLKYKPTISGIFGRCDIGIIKSGYLTLSTINKSHSKINSTLDFYLTTALGVGITDYLEGSLGMIWTNTYFMSNTEKIIKTTPIFDLNLQYRLDFIIFDMISIIFALRHGFMPKSFMQNKYEFSFIDFYLASGLVYFFEL